jgi:hypothetical protein
VWTQGPRQLAMLAGQPTCPGPGLSLRAAAANNGQPLVTKPGRRSGARRGTGRVPEGPRAHLGDAGEGSLARGSWSATQSAAVLGHLRGESAMAAAIPGVLARFVGRGGRARGCRASRLVRGSRGGAERRPYPTAMAALLCYWEESTGRRGREEERNKWS